MTILYYTMILVDVPVPTEVMSQFVCTYMYVCVCGEGRREGKAETTGLNVACSS